MKHEIKRTYRYRLYPNGAQKQELARTFGCSRWVYNWALETKTKAYYMESEGDLDRSGNEYTIRTADGATISFPKANVLSVTAVEVESRE